MADNPFALQQPDAAAAAMKPHVHVISEKRGIRCETEKAGRAWTVETASPAELVLDASKGFIPLWEPGVTLHWRFRPGTLGVFQNPEAAREAIEALLAEAILGWGPAAPVRFAKSDDLWDFEIVMKATDDCNANGCVLAQAFFPDAGQHPLYIWPRMFTQSRAEQVETLQHEIGHIFGLRHFFALISETQWSSVLFGQQSKFTIMNYGDDSRLTDQDRSDLKTLYKLAWSKQLTEINGTEIRFMKPYHVSAPQGAFAIAAAVSG